MKDQIKHALSDKATKEEVQKALSKALSNLANHGICSGHPCEECIDCIAEQLQKEGVIK